MFVLYLLIACAIHANAHERINSIRATKDHVLIRGVHKVPVERRIFNFRKNGIEIDVKVVPSDDEDDNGDDYFPEFPVKDIGKCIIEFSLGCIRKRLVRYLETVGRLDEITLLGQDVKLVKNARSDGTTRNDSDVSIESSVDDLFDSFTLRITLPRWNSKRERNQIDVMLDETAVAEGRRERGRKKGGKGGGKCKMMMMGMLMMIKTKLMGIAAIKGMMMGGMSLMVTMMMLMQKFGKGGAGGPWQSGGGGGGQLKEIVFLTKSSAGGGGGGCCGGGPSDSYGAPPPSGSPSGGGGGYGGNGWGRSFHRQSMTLSRDGAIKMEAANVTDHVPTIGEIFANKDSIDYPNYPDDQEPPVIATSNSVASDSNARNHIAFQEYEAADLSSANSVKSNDSEMEPTVVAKGRSIVFNDGPVANIVDEMRKKIDSAANTSEPETETDLDKNILRPIYTDEWRTTAEKRSNAASSDSQIKFESPRSQRVKDIPLLRGI
ncbi:PREDICTED: uncharacterized protein LOC106744945 [Dinoponera quadriceps]|uniref:Uncharacterized protein LOC106744945 n=1 Tax=Dinoponera quadriceps TaxID=609295 RepID=A0A6P3XCJ0_DINQU|nr:PREDICTED: uncharacterized protein LOC106744945 [Dinoponera quadriceps]